MGFFAMSVGEAGEPKVTQIFAYRNCLYTMLLYGVSDYEWNECSKRVIPRKDVPYGDINDVSLNFGVNPPKKRNFWPMNRTFKRERQKNQVLIT